MHSNMIQRINDTLEIVRKAKAQRQSLWGNGRFAQDFEKAEVALRKEITSLSQIIDRDHSEDSANLMSSTHRLVEELLGRNTSPERKLRAGAELRRTYTVQIEP